VSYGLSHGDVFELARFLQFRQTRLRLIRAKGIGIFFYEPPIKFRSCGVELLFQLRGTAGVLAYRVHALIGVDDLAGGGKPDALMFFHVGDRLLQVFDSERLADEHRV
jgi:hypothetical protein